jgi:hypothetical protein
MRRSDCGTGRSDMLEREIGDTPSRGRQSHARSKCAASPCCRTFRNARTRRIRREPPRRKSASRRLCNAMGGAGPLPPGGPWHFVCGNGAECRYGRRDITNPLPPGNSAKRIREDFLPWQGPSARGCGSMYYETRGAGWLIALRSMRAQAKKPPSLQIVDNPVRVGDNHS